MNHETKALRAIAETLKKRFTNMTVTETIDFASEIIDAIHKAGIQLSPESL